MQLYEIMQRNAVLFTQFLSVVTTCIIIVYSITTRKLTLVEYTDLRTYKLHMRLCLCVWVGVFSSVTVYVDSSVQRHSQDQEQFHHKVFIGFDIILYKKLYFVKDILGWPILMYYLWITGGAKTSSDDAYNIYLLFFSFYLLPSYCRLFSSFILLDRIAS